MPGTIGGMAIVGASEVPIWKILAGLLIACSIAVMFTALSEDWSCEAEELEAIRALELIHHRETKLKGTSGAYAPMDTCAFSEEGHGCVSKFGFFLPGDSTFAYRVVVTDAGFVATGVGASDRQFGAMFSIDQSGRLTRAGVCGK